MRAPMSESHSAIASRVIGNIVQAGPPKVSPDGTLVAFPVARVDEAKNKTFSQIWLASVDGSAPPRPLTSGDHDGEPAWSPDGRSLAFLSRRGDKKAERTLHVIPIGETGEVRTIATIKDSIGGLEFSPDGRWIGFIGRTPDERYAAEDVSWQSPRKIERFFSRLNGEDWIFDRPAHVYVVPADGSRSPRNLTPGEFQHDGVSWTPDSAAIVTSAQRHDTWDRDLAQDLYLVPLAADSEVVALTKQTGAYYAAERVRRRCIGGVHRHRRPDAPTRRTPASAPSRSAAASTAGTRSRSTGHSSPPPGRCGPAGSTARRCSARPRIAGRPTCSASAPSRPHRNG